MRVGPRVFMDIQTGEEKPLKIIIELFDKQVPKSAENFHRLCTGRNEKGLSYLGTFIHRIIAPEFIIQGGDNFQLGREDAHTTPAYMKLSPESYLGGCSIYGGQFEDENLGWNGMQQSGLVCMANRGPATNSNGSQFFITLVPLPDLAPKTVVIGHIISPDIRELRETLATIDVDEDDKPLEPVTIVRCGNLRLK